MGDDSQPARERRRRGLWGLGDRIPRLGALADRQRRETFDHWDLGFNGQRGRQRMLSELVASTGVDTFVETGTFRGRTASYVRHYFRLPVWSVELVPRSYELCRWRFRDDPDVHLARGDSRDFLRSMAQELTGRRCLFYLDAHWYDDLPLADELRIISRGWDEYVVVVDDFRVDDDSSYFYDDYGPGLSLELANLPLSEIGAHAAYFPTLRGGDDDYPWRGCVVIGRGDPMCEALNAIPSLRPAGQP
jgi:hypothetical protein